MNGETMKSALLTFTAIVFCLVSTRVIAQTSAPPNIGSRLELFVDDWLVDRFERDAKFHLHKPLGKEVVLMNDQPWEDTTMGYFSVLKDGDTYRMYYRGHHHGGGEDARGEPMCYAESDDGVRWTKPKLGLFRFQGSADNNIVLGGDAKKYLPTNKWQGELGFETDLGWRGDMVPFIDTNSNATPDARYKALVRGARGAHQIPGKHTDYGLYPFKSPDGLNWTLMSEKPVITKGRFDSQNLAFWDPVRGRYVAFVRDLIRGAIRNVHVSVSDDFVQWTEPVPLNYSDKIDRQMYTNGILPYERAPHLFVAFPTEFINLFAAAQVHPILMTSRDGGHTFLRHREPLIPGTAPQERDGNRSNFMAHGLVRGNEREYFVYATEGYGYEESDALPEWKKRSFAPRTRLRRFVYRVDGFVSIRSGPSRGAVVTKPFVFDGGEVQINYIAWPRGEIRVEIQDAKGQPIKGFTLNDCKPLRGDEIDHPVTWQSGLTPGHLAGTPVRLRFQLKHADLFSFRFVQGKVKLSPSDE
jgi:hypothetical protein